MIFQTWKIYSLNSKLFQTFPGSVRTLSFVTNFFAVLVEKDKRTNAKQQIQSY